MEATSNRVHNLEAASFIDRIGLFAGAGCNPQQALGFCFSSMECDSAICREIRAVASSGRVGQSPADILYEVGRRTGSEELLLAGLAFSAHLKLGAEISEPLKMLAEALRWHHRARLLADPGSVRELAVTLFAYKFAFLTDIDVVPPDALALLAEYDAVLGTNLLQIRDDLKTGHALPRAFGLAAERLGSNGMRLLAAGFEVGDASGASRSNILRRTADAMRRDVDV